MKKFFELTVASIKFGSIFFGFIGLVAVVYLDAKLPSVESLKDVQFQVPLRIYSADKKLIAEFGEKRRDPVKLEEVPEDLINAILATEDVRFYTHPGVDLKGIIRAAVLLLTNGKKQQGGSTITMQVARNFFLTRKKTYIRKLNEILLALRIEKHLTKKEILELYLNKIYLGKRAYGVAAAAGVYYGKGLKELNLAQMAMIAGLPQAPSAKNPLNNPAGALKRREHVLSRMLNYEFINKEQYHEAASQPITAKYHGREKELEAPYVAEMVRQKLVEVYGEDVYDKGFEVYTTINSNFQESANYALSRAVLEYDQRHGYREHIARFTIPENLDTNTEELLNQWQEKLQNIPKVNKLEPAVVISNTDNSTHVMLWNGNFEDIKFNTMKWAGKSLRKQLVGRLPTNPSQVVKTGDVIYVSKKTNGQYAFAQEPEVEGSLVAIDPNTGALLSLVGGFDFYKSRFNRVIQAERQPGSNFKPFIYSAALEHGFTAASIINDAPIVESDSYGEFDWRPQNYTKKFYGPTRLRVGVTKSRNLVTIRVLKALGLDNTIEFLKRFGFDDSALPRGLSLALGSGTMTPLELAVGFSAFPNGGYRVSPYLITKIKDYNDETIFEHVPTVICKECFKNEPIFKINVLEDTDEDTALLTDSNDVEESIEHKLEAKEKNNLSDYVSSPEDNTELLNKKIAPRVMSPQTAYIMSSILQDAIQTGTGKMAKGLGRNDLAGKTGTTNNFVDAWYSGFNKDIVVTTWMGYDEPRNMREYSANTALPMWIYFMEQALKEIPERELPQPDGLVTVKIDPNTGKLAREWQQNSVYEVFTKSSVPREYTSSTKKYLTSNPQDKMGDEANLNDEHLKEELDKSAELEVEMNEQQSLF